MKKYEAIAEQIRRRIVSGSLPMGARLPAEKDLEIGFGASTQTVDKAFSILVSAGLLERRPGTGTFVVGQDLVQRMKESYPFLVGVLLESGVNDIADPDSVLPQMMLYLQLLLNQRNLRWTVLSFRDSAERRRRLDSVDGFITVGDVPEGFVEQMVMDKKPAITFNRDLSSFGTPAVLVSTQSMVDLIAEARRLGHRRFLYVTDDANKPVYELRFQEFGVSAKKTAGDVSVRRLIIRRSDLVSGVLLPNVRAALKSGDCAFLPRDSMAIEFLRVLAENGVNVPGDLSVCGYDNSVAGRHLPVPLTTIAYDIMETCSLLAQYMRLLFAGRPVPMTTRVDSWLIVRDSLGRRR